MIDIVDRLRRQVIDASARNPVDLDRAATEIETLRAKLEEVIYERDAIRQAMHDAINRPKGVVPTSAEPFYAPSVFYPTKGTKP